MEKIEINTNKSCTFAIINDLEHFFSFFFLTVPVKSYRTVKLTELSILQDSVLFYTRVHIARYRQGVKVGPIYTTNFRVKH